MAETSFGVTYDGPALDSGRMAVRDLAPALLALSDLFVEAGVLLYPEQPPLALNVKAAPEQGSFVVHLLLEGKDLWNQLVGMFSSSDMTALLALKELVIGGDVSLFGLIKRLRDHQIVSQQEVPESGNIRLTVDDETSVEVPSSVLTLYRTVSIRKKARAAIAPVTKEGIEKVEFHTEQTVTVEVTAGDAPAFDLAETEKALQEDVEERFLTVVSPVFREGNKWRMSDGGASFWVTVEDSTFLARVKARIESFRQGDVLKCQLRIVQSERDGKLHTERYLLSVLGRQKGTPQLDLLPPSG